MTDIVVDVADARFSRDPKDVLHAPSLGCCVSVMLYDPQVKAGGLVICALPDAGIAESFEAEEHPFMFIDLAIPRLLEKAVEIGIQPEKSKIILAGGGTISGQAGEFDIGRQNGRKTLEVLDHYGLRPTFESLGGGLNRSLSLEMRTGTVRISSAGKEIATL
ncbi:MAG: chemotaxis protein CheD [Desulfosarcinaceae bacterium]